MSDAVLQYQEIRNTITNNLNVLRGLVEQAESMHRVVESLGEGDASQKQELNTNIQNIYSSIDVLASQTDRLLKTFIKFASETEVIKA